MKKNFTSITSFTLILLFIVSCTALPHKPARGNGGGPRNPRGGGGQGGNGGGGGVVLTDMRGGDIGNFTGTSIKDITYGNNSLVPGSNVKTDLNLDIYFPDVDHAGKKYPLILWIHGGGFKQGDKSTANKLCSRAAGNGFVTASINYRAGWTGASVTERCSGDSTGLKIAIYYAVQDARAALRFLAANADKYSIDTNWIFIAGPSAGGVTSLYTKYSTQTALNGFLPGASSTYGLIDRAGNNLTNTYTIKSVCSMWGALNDPTLITQQNVVPTLFLHGMKDPVVPYATGSAFSCRNFITVNGSSVLYNRTMNVLKTPAVAIYDPNGGHGIYDNNSNCDNMCTFFKSVINKNPIKGTYQYNVKLQQ